MGLSFSVVESGVPEPAPRGRVNVGDYVRRLARRKAEAVARRVSEGLVLGADTVVARGGRIYGKPKDRREARRILQDLSGRRHVVFTAVALAARPGKRVWVDVQKTEVWMRALSPREVTRYSRAHHDKAGAYAAQARGNPYVENFRGDYDTVVGLPRRAVDNLLAKAERAGFVVKRRAIRPRSD